MITAGFDIGTKFIKVCIVKNGAIVGYDIRELKGTFQNVVKASYKAALNMAHMFGFLIKAKGATGFGSNLIKQADFTLDTETCAAKAATFFNPKTRTVIDAGALFINICSIGENGKILDRAENEKCAAGSGKFLEIVASSLHVPVEQISDFASKSTNPYKISNSCAVFAESEVISRINMGEVPNDIIAGIIKSIGQKVFTMYTKTEASPPVTVIGGLAKIPYFVQSLSETLKEDIDVISMDPQLAGAFGAAIFAAERKARR
jgi:(R)-2-hydroxyacyl-CoA dehydratese activating ATPase